MEERWAQTITANQKGRPAGGPSSWYAGGQRRSRGCAVGGSGPKRVGDAGVSAVCRDFELIGWGPVRNSEHDKGTDLLVQAWSAPGSGYRLVVGVQVKAGESRFARAEVDGAGRVAGWWYYERDTAHFDSWVTHRLPHLLVLHNLEEGKSYWVHVTADKVVSVGKGCKILVPSDQTIDEEHADGLFAAACEHKGAPLIEGTAFSGLPGGISQARRLRYALVAPRLVAPHPNARQADPIDPVEGTALLAQGRFHDLLRFADKHDRVPDPKEPYSGRDWGWKFVAAFWHWACTDSADRLEAVFAAARSPEEAAASGVVQACALHRIEKCGKALEVLDGLVDGGDLSPVDHGWVLVQRARFRAESGDFDGARVDAVSAQRCFAGDRDDVTASALAAAAAWQLYAAAWLADPSDWAAMNEEFNELVATADTAVSWWRAQTISRGLGRVETKRFEAWADPYPRYLVRWEAPKTQELLAAEFSADVTGEHGSWRHACAMYGRQRLVGAADEDNEAFELAEGLRALRRSGDHKSLQKALRRLSSDGPLGPVAEAVNKIPVGGWTRTTADSNFEALAAAGDLAEEPLATDLACWAAAQVRDPADMVENLRPSLTVPMAALKAVSGLLFAAGNPAHAAAARVVAGLADPPPHMTSNQVCEAIDRLDYAKVDAGGRQALWEKALAETGPVSVAALGWLAANGRPDAEAEAISRAAGGDLHAIEAIADISAVGSGDARAVIGHLAAAADQNLAVSRGGTHGGDRIDAAYWLAAMGFEHPGLARWDEALELLFDPQTAGHDKVPACRLVAQNADRLPADVRAALASNTAAIAEAATGAGFADDIGGIDSVLAVTVGTLVGDDAATAMAELVSGTPEQRRDAAMLLGWGQLPGQRPLLAALARDPHPIVRNQSALAIGRLAATDPSPPICALARDLARKDGVLTPSALLAGLARACTPSAPAALEIAQHLDNHPSAIVRGWTKRILE